MRLFVENLTNIDFSYLDDKRGLVGETWLASIELDGSLDDQGMVCDFGIVKRKLRDWLDAQLDHCLLVPKLSPALQWQASADRCQLDWRLDSQTHIASSAPTDAITFIDVDVITPEKVAAWCIAQLRSLFPDTIASLHLRFDTETIDGPYYHYSHGLKKHRGNCQRIAHGHRSKIEIWRNGEYSHADMREWADRWQDIYVGTREDILAEDATHYHFQYRAQQGEFSLTMPRDRCYLLDTDSTVEFIAQHLADHLRERYPQDEIVIKAYEGMGKGARVIL